MYILVLEVTEVFLWYGLLGKIAMYLFRNSVYWWKSCLNHTSMCRNMIDLLIVCILMTSTNVLVCTTFTLPAHMPKTDYFSSQGQVMRGKVCTMIYLFKVSKKYMVCVFSCLQRRDIACFLTCLFVSTADCY